ncbi:DVUA0089 family protein [Euzebya sp.]|uniref:DVUA0089 family protein n=1 Tax=Euzebya sp. TaxID=1971409 RepID=UPI0035183CE2
MSDDQSWGQPPPPPPPDQGGWGQDPGWGQQPPPPQPGWGQQPQWGQPPPGQPGPWGPQPSTSSSGSKVLWIVLAVVLGIVLIFGIGVFLVIRSAGDTVQDAIESFEQLDLAELQDAEIPDAPRLLETGGSIGDGDVGEFTFEVRDRTRVQIDVVGRGDFDPEIALLGPDGVLIDEDDDGGSAFFASRITETLDQGTYTLEVTEFGGDSGSFDVVVSDL